MVPADFMKKMPILRLCEELSSNWCCAVGGAPRCFGKMAEQLLHFFDKLSLGERADALWSLWTLTSVLWKDSCIIVATLSATLYLMPLELCWRGALCCGCFAP